MRTPEEINALNQYVRKNFIAIQKQLLSQLLFESKETLFAQDHRFSDIQNDKDYKNQVPIREYDGFNKYWDLIFQGHENILSKDKPIYFASSSGTTGRSKYIPVTQASLDTFLNMTNKPLMQYVYDYQDYDLLSHPMMALTGPSSFKKHQGFLTGAISTFCRQNLSTDIQNTLLPSNKTLELMRTDGWDVMFHEAAKEAIKHSISVCNGMTAFMMQLFYECCKVGKTWNLQEILPNLRVIMTHGANYRPYLSQLKNLFNHKLNVLEIYGASEGALAYQDCTDDIGMLLNLDDGIYFEFIKLEENHLEQPPRYNVEEIEINTSYIPIITTNAGLWGYKLGDILEFTSVNPPRIKILGRTTQFISIVTEHVYAHNVENTIKDICTEKKLIIVNFHVTPMQPGYGELPYYEWYIELQNIQNSDLNNFNHQLDEYLSKYSVGYKYCLDNNVFSPSKVKFVTANAFSDYLKQKKVLSLQLKVPKLANERTVADYLIKNNCII